jgi:hypothetical protein
VSSKKLKIMYVHARPIGKLMSVAVDFMFDSKCLSDVSVLDHGLGVDLSPCPGHKFKDLVG